MSENQQALKHVVSMEDLTVDQVMKLIKRGICLLYTNPRPRHT